MLCLLILMAQANPIRIGIRTLEPYWLTQSRARELTQSFGSYLNKDTGLFLADCDVVDRELQNHQLDSTDGCGNSCLADIGQRLGFDVVAKGTVGKSGKVYAVTLTLISPQDGKLLDYFSLFENCPVEALENCLMANLADTVRKRLPIILHRLELKTSLFDPDRHVQDTTTPATHQGKAILTSEHNALHWDCAALNNTELCVNYERLLSSKIGVCVEPFIQLSSGGFSLNTSLRFHFSDKPGQTGLFSPYAGIFTRYAHLNGSAKTTISLNGEEQTSEKHDFRVNLFSLGINYGRRYPFKWGLTAAWRAGYGLTFGNFDWKNIPAGFQPESGIEKVAFLLYGIDAELSIGKAF